MLDFVVDAVSDLAGNAAESPASTSVTVGFIPCGRAEFSGNNLTSIQTAFVVNSKTPLTDGAVDITALNPDGESLHWINNARIQSISLLYRKSGTSEWLPALDSAGSAARFVDSVSLSICLCLNTNKHVCSYSLDQEQPPQPGLCPLLAMASTTL